MTLEEAKAQYAKYEQEKKVLELKMEPIRIEINRTCGKRCTCDTCKQYNQFCEQWTTLDEKMSDLNKIIGG